MTAPTPEKAAPIPAEVLDAAAAEVLDILNREAILFPICAKSKRLAARVARAAIMQDRADRASQEERIREDERALADARECLTTLSQWFEQREANKPTTNTEATLFARLDYSLTLLEARDEAAARLRGGAS